MQKDNNNGMICGVCAGIAAHLGIDALVVRAAFVLASIFGFGLPVLVYIILALLMPSK